MKLSTDTLNFLFDILLNYFALLKAAYRQCDFQLKCSCGKDNSFTDYIILYKLVAGVSDTRLAAQYQAIMNSDTRKTWLNSWL